MLFRSLYEAVVVACGVISPGHSYETSFVAAVEIRLIVLTSWGYTSLGWDVDLAKLFFHFTGSKEKNYRFWRM